MGVPNKVRDGPLILELKPFIQPINSGETEKRRKTAKGKRCTLSNFTDNCCLWSDQERQPRRKESKGLKNYDFRKEKIEKWNLNKIKPIKACVALTPGPSSVGSIMPETTRWKTSYDFGQIRKVYKIKSWSYFFNIFDLELRKLLAFV